MLKPQRAKTRRHWESLSDEMLMSVELVTDNPDALEGMVFKLPDVTGEEPHVEYAYDLRGSEHEKFRCVHCNQPHLAGFVMRSGQWRFKVGHICGNHIYGEVFDEYHADYNAAVNRKDALLRVAGIKEALKPFFAWMEGVLKSEVFKNYNRVRGQVRERMPWIYDNLQAAAHAGTSISRVKLPRSLFDEDVDPRLNFAKAAAEMSAIATGLVTSLEIAAKSIGQIKLRMEATVTRIEGALDLLKEAEDFFQPQVLDIVCKLANEYDNPKKRKYEAGLLSITCRRGKEKITVQPARNFGLPNRKPIEAFRAALMGWQG